jgi:hypothetical protein
LLTPITKGYSRARHEILDSRRDEQLARPCSSGNPSPYMNGNAADSSVHYLALARVDASSDFYVQLAEAANDVASARDRFGGAFKGS